MHTVITGLGVISPRGTGPEALIRGAGPTSWIDDGWPARAGEPVPCMKVAESDVRDALKGERVAHLNRESTLLLAAARLALADARDPGAAMDSTGIVVSTRHAGLQDYAELYWNAAGEETDVSAEQTRRRRRPKVSPMQGPQTGLNAPAAHLSIRLGARGPNMTISNGSAGGIDALTYAADALQNGGATRMLVGGVDTVPRVALALGLDRCATGAAAVARPFDVARTGTLLGEAAVVAVLERGESAQRRSASVRATLTATASAFAPDGDLEDAAGRALRSLLRDCSLSPQQMGAVFAGANGSLEGDAAESRALSRLFGERVPIYAVNGCSADAMGAAALVQLAAAIVCLECGQIPATCGFHSLGEGVAAIGVLTAPVPLEDAPVLVHAWDAPSCSAAAILAGHSSTTAALCRPAGIK